MSLVINPVAIGGKRLGDGQPCYMIAQIGMNHNGDLDLAQKLIEMAVHAGCDAVAFQKRTVDLGTAKGDPGRGLEFGPEDFERIDACCKSFPIPWFVSCWDEQCVDFIKRFDVPCFKIASALLKEANLLRHTRMAGKPIILSTGMSTIEEIDYAVEVLGRENLILMHATSAHQATHPELNLRVIRTLRERYCVPVGYSGHETGNPTSIASLALGACCIERHITMNRAMSGAGQAAALEPKGITRLVRDVRRVERSMGDGVKRAFERKRPAIQESRPIGMAISA